jgi:hypothetical protein
MIWHDGPIFISYYNYFVLELFPKWLNVVQSGHTAQEIFDIFQTIYLAREGVTYLHSAVRSIVYR